MRTRGIDPGASVDSGVGRLQLNILTQGDDIEAYLTTFERLMLGYGVKKNRWSYSLPPNLTGKAQQALQRVFMTSSRKPYSSAMISLIPRHLKGVERTIERSVWYTLYTHARLGWNSTTTGYHRTRLWYVMNIHQFSLQFVKLSCLQSTVMTVF